MVITFRKERSWRMDEFTIVRLDPTANNQQANTNVLQALDVSSGPVFIHNTLDECATYIRSSVSPIPVIANGAVGEEITQRVHDLIQVESI